MQILDGVVSSGFGTASRNLAPVTSTIAARTGLGRLATGTLNVRIATPFIVDPEAIVNAEEYDGSEYLKLRRCVIGGIRAVIVRPNLHEIVQGWGHGIYHLELVSRVHLRTALGGLRDSAPVRIEVGGDDAWWARASSGDVELIRGQFARAHRRIGRALRVA